MTQIHGLGSSLALKLIGECGTDLRAWPRLYIVALPRARQQDLRWQSAFVTDPTIFQPSSCGGSDTALGAFYRRMAGRIGKHKAVTARKIAVLFYNALRFGVVYRDQGAAAYDELHRGRVIANLQRRGRSMGYEQAPVTAGDCVSWERLGVDLQTLSNR